MSDTAEKEMPAAAPSAPREVHAPMTSFVKGGTVSSAYERHLQEKKADAEKRRAAEDARHAALKQDPLGAKMATPFSAKAREAAIVLEIRNSDNRAEEFLVCELVVGGDPSELTLCMICPKCAIKYGSSEANFKFSNKHKRFELDQRRAGELWVNPKDPNEFCTIAGTIHLQDAVRCPGLGCEWRFKIDDSVVKSL